MSKRFTEGICSDGAAILDNGEQITITEILNNLNRLDELEAINFAHSSTQLKEKEGTDFEEFTTKHFILRGDKVYSKETGNYATLQDMIDKYKSQH